MCEKLGETSESASFCDLRGPGGLYSTPRYFLPRRKRVMARILVIDDDPVILQTMERVLARDSHLVEAYADARKALDALRRERPDLVITDLFMPEMDGIEFLLSLREAETNLPVIVTSGGGATSAHHLLTDAALGETGVAVTSESLAHRVLVFAGFRAGSGVLLRIDGAEEPRTADERGRVSMALEPGGPTRIEAVSR